MSSCPNHTPVESCLPILLLETSLITNQGKNQLRHIPAGACLHILCILSDLMLLWVRLKLLIIDHLHHIQWNTWVLIGCHTHMVLSMEALGLFWNSHHQERGLLRSAAHIYDGQVLAVVVFESKHKLSSIFIGCIVFRNISSDVYNLTSKTCHQFVNTGLLIFPSYLGSTGP